MEIKNKKEWETPVLKDLNVNKTESAIYYSPTETTYGNPSGLPV